ncbi:MAG: hypothetical protein V4668_01025 [Patescibacteria group bacterium]
MTITRRTHVHWCRTQALSELGEGSLEEIAQSLKAFVTGLANHPATRFHPSIAVATFCVNTGIITNKTEMEELLNEFNY